MYDMFGEMDSAEEINAAAGGLKKEGDKKNLLKLAAENGIDRAFVDMYLDGTTEVLCCDAATAALGKIEVEAAVLKPVEIMDDWVEYIRILCGDDEEFARAVRMSGKSLDGCIAHLLKWSYENMYDIPARIKGMAGISRQVKEGIPGMGKAKKLIREYYLGTGGAEK